MATTTVSTLIPSQTIPSTSQTDLLTASTGTLVIIDKLTATNTSGVPVALNVNIVNSGGSQGNSNLIVNSQSISIAETYELTEIERHSLSAGDTLSVLATVSNAITVRGSGRIITQ